ncbi:hypothetical protein FRC12_004495 [Ceratobasidium sp. 428]|nr:hypothetical protein FRC12_004495 [Ceratobasidium sp. 428]
MQNDITALIHMTPSQRRVSPLEEAGITQSEHGGMLWALLDKCWGSDPETRPDATALQIQLGAIFRRRIERPPSPTINSANELPNTGVVSYIIERGCPDLSKLLALPLVEERPFAHGGFGDVYRGVLKDNQQVAIKCFRSRLGMTEQAHTDRGALKAIARELYAWSKLKHEHVLPLLGVVNYRGSIGLVSPWMHNGSLPQYLLRYPRTNRCNLSIQVAEGVVYLHSQNIIHGDLKGVNILISDDGHALITDFGNTVLNEYSLSLVSSSTTCGMSMRWAAPEILTGEGRRSTKSDIYALGMVSAYIETFTGIDHGVTRKHRRYLLKWTMQEIVTGGVPFKGMSDIGVVREVAIRRGIPKRPYEKIHGEGGDILWEILLGCWTFDPNRRTTASQIVVSLKNITEEDHEMSDITRPTPTRISPSAF